MCVYLLWDLHRAASVLPVTVCYITADWYSHSCQDFTGVPDKTRCSHSANSKSVSHQFCIDERQIIKKQNKTKQAHSCISCISSVIFCSSLLWWKSSSCSQEHCHVSLFRSAAACRQVSLVISHVLYYSWSFLLLYCCLCLSHFQQITGNSWIKFSYKICL